MKKYIGYIQEFLKNIFLEEVFIASHSSIPRDLTEHYKKQLVSCSLDHVIVARSYHEVEDIIEAYKYRSERWHASEIISVIAYILSESLYMSKLGEDVSKFTIIPVPMHWTRYFFRGFNHITKIAKGLSKQLNIGYSACISAQFSWRQSQLSRTKRLENRRNRFSISLRSIVPENVILIDDVISTGSTANECAKVLKEAGAKKVIGIFFASSAD